MRTRSGIGGPGTTALAVAIVAFLAATLSGLLLPVGPAAAHTDLLQGSPGPAQTVGGDVEFIDLVFFEAVSDLELTLEAPSGAMIDGEVTVPDGQIIRYEMPALTEPGRHIVRYTMVSADGDFTETGYFFTYDPDGIQPLRLGDADVPSNTGNIVTIVASIVLAVCLIGLVLLLLARVERNRAAAAVAETAGDE